ncbi:hypothetical protein [Moorena sp. SIO3I8]|uniref:hypothetical protein n=1 Tax=Moorena sp. SIO3I8 TaxID=2607833 RepID=UPI0013C12471|nr:hypothetical protein [Moorena sp. SIO3I8]NEO07806.1 hypothetical protein [Moorena sp. SIO3I8]
MKLTCYIVNLQLSFYFAVFLIAFGIGFVVLPVNTGFAILGFPAISVFLALLFFLKNVFSKSNEYLGLLIANHMFKGIILGVTISPIMLNGGSSYTMGAIGSYVFVVAGTLLVCQLCASTIIIISMCLLTILQNLFFNLKNIELIKNTTEILHLFILFTLIGLFVKDLETLIDNSTEPTILTSCSVIILFLWNQLSFIKAYKDRPCWSNVFKNAKSFLFDLSIYSFFPKNE